MNLTCKINGIEYPIVQGNTFADEYNETLDSGSVIIAHVKKIKKLKPFDDVFVYDSNFKFGGYSYGTDALKPGDVVDTNGNKKLDNIFFKHLLVDNYTEEFVNLKDKTYKYKISLMSETKGLEKVQCPNISVTQPLNPDKKVSIYEYLVRFTNMYSPKFKKVMNDRTKTWVYAPKYKVDESLEEIFGNVYPPDFSLNAPTLRDILSKLMVCKDMIPYVENGVIKAMDITQRKNEFSLDDIPTTNIVGSMSSNDYCDALRRNYSDGLSQDSTCESVEYLGFRNSETSLMTLGNMRLETRFPIYKINKLYMYYYKKADYTLNNREFFFLCKQDITPLVKLNTERNALSKDWDNFTSEPPLSIEDLAQYKLATIGYDIGSKYITGWGEQYSYPKGWWLTSKKTYIENILLRIDSIHPFGDSSFEEKIGKDIDKEDLSYHYGKNVFDNIITPFETKLEDNLNVKSALNMKGLFFEIDYQGFFNGAVVVSKDDGLDNIVANDNSSSSLALLEYDGLSQKEKVNRLGNKTYQFTVRYDNYGNDLSFLQNVGDYFKHDDEEDIIIYHREYSIYDTYVIATYFAAKDYVLKNYYTSVYARHRTWNLMSYGESVHRAENRKTCLLLSKNNSYYENIKIDDSINIKKFLNCFSASGEIKSYNDWENNDKINFGFILHKSNYYSTDVNSFLSGYSLCFNISMVDNISMGSYISNLSPFIDKKYGDKEETPWYELTRDFFDVNDDYTGSNVSLHSIIDDNETGAIERLGFYVGHNTSKLPYSNFSGFVDENILGLTTTKKIIGSLYENFLTKLPKANPHSEGKYGFLLSHSLGEEINIYKDNKEYIDMTYQIEPITNDKNVLFSQWFMRLNDLLGNFYKTNINKEWEQTNTGESSEKIYFYSGSYSEVFMQNSHWIPRIVLAFKKDYYNTILENLNFGYKEYVSLYDINGLQFKHYEDESNLLGFFARVVYLSLIPRQIEKVEETENGLVLQLGVEQTIKYKVIGSTENKQIKSNQTIIFNQINKDFDGTPLNDDYMFFSCYLDKLELPENYSDYENFSTQNSIFRLFNGYNITDKNIFDENGNTPFNPQTGIFSEYSIKIYNYYKNMYVVTSRESLRNTLVYDEYKQANFPDSLNVREDISVSDVFKVGEDEHGSFIEIDITQFRYDGIKSIQYWFKDIVNNDPDNSLMKFVFGVNLTDEDLRHHTVKVYASLVSNRDTRVYDQNHNVVGEVVNYLDENNEKPYGQNQYYMVK